MTSKDAQVLQFCSSLVDEIILSTIIGKIAVTDNSKASPITPVRHVESKIEKLATGRFGVTTLQRLLIIIINTFLRLLEFIIGLIFKSVIAATMFCFNVISIAMKPL